MKNEQIGFCAHTQKSYTYIFFSLYIILQLFYLEKMNLAESYETFILLSSKSSFLDKYHLDRD